MSYQEDEDNISERNSASTENVSLWKETRARNSLILPIETAKYSNDLTEFL